MNRPESITIPPLYSGAEAVILWSVVDGADWYILNRKTNLSTEFEQVYMGRYATFTDVIPLGVDSVTYEVAAAAEINHTWEEINNKTETYTWHDLDSLAWSWARFSDWTSSGEISVESKMPPIISGQDGDLGTRYAAFSITFSVADPNPANEIDVAVYLNDIIIPEWDNVRIEQNANYSIIISDSQISEMEDGSTNTIMIVATDDEGLSSRRIFTFTVVEDIVSSANFYVFRDGMNIQHLGQNMEFQDFTAAAGIHQYFVRGIDENRRFSDSNVVEMVTGLKNPVIAPADDPANILNLVIRRDQPPQISKSSSVSFSEVKFEGNRRVIQMGSGAFRDSYNLSFSSISRQIYDRIGELMGIDLLYRDQNGEKAYVRILQYDPDYICRNIGIFDLVHDFSIQMLVIDYDEEIDYV